MRGSAVFRTGIAPGGALAGPWVRDPLWTRARAVPSLDLRFADNKSLTDAVTGAQLVTFTRASSGTFVGSDGALRSAVTNLLLRSEEFNDATWTKTNSTVTTNATTAPNGMLTAEKLITNSGASSGRASVSITVATDTPATLSCYAKQGETSVFGLFISDGVTGRAADFDLSTGTVSGTPTAGMSASIQSVGDGWYRCIVTVASASLAGTTRSLRVVQTVVGNDGTSGLFIWGAQFEQSSTVGEYIPTTSTINSAPRFDHNPTTGESLGLLVEEARTNLNLYSEDFSNATYSLTAATVSTNTSVAPDGTTTADTVNSSGTAVVSQSFTKAASAITYTGSLFVKGSVTDFSLTIDDGTTVNRGRARFNLSTGTLGSVTNDGTFTGTTATITLFPNGWYRLTLTTTTNILITARLRPFWTGAGTSIDFWGAQLETGSFATSYIPTTSATVTRAADVASITGSNFGTTRTNLLVRSEEFDNASWTKTRSSITANAITAPDGTLTGDKLIDSTDASASHFISQSISFVSGTTYTVSIFAKQDEIRYLRLGFNATPFGTTQIVFFDLLNGVISSNPNALAASITDAGNGWWRLAVTATATATASDLILISLSSNGTSISFTGTGTNGLYIWGAQLETSSAVTPYIPTTSAAVSVFESSWYNQTEGTVFAEAISVATNTSVFSISDNSTNNRIQLETGSNTRRFRITSSGSARYDNSVSYTFGTQGKTAGAYLNTSTNHATNGTLGTNSTASPLPVVDRIYIGSNAAGSLPNNGPIKRLAYWGQRFANSTLQAISQP